jgi:integrase
MAFRIEVATISSDSGPLETSRVMWDSEPVTTTADEVMRTQASENGSALRKAEEWLQETLSEPIPAVEVSRIYVDGREYTASTDLVATERNKNGAMRIEAKARELVKAGRAHELRLEIKPFNEAAMEFLSWADGEYAAHPNTAKRLRTSFASLGVFFGKAPVSTILRGHVNDFKAWRRQQKVKEVTIRHDLHALSKACQYWTDHNWTRDNPVRGVDIPSDKDAVRMYVLSQAIEMQYFEQARRYPALYDLGRLMIQQGCRPEEVLSLRVDDVDLERWRLIIQKGKSNASRRTLRLTPESREICARKIAVAKSEWLFPGKKRGTHATKLNGSHEKVLERLPGLAFVLYDFRHTFATRAAEAGMPVATLARILGHGDLRSVMKYVHVGQEAQDRAMEQYVRSGFGPVDSAENRENEVLGGKSQEGLNARKIN